MALRAALLTPMSRVQAGVRAAAGLPVGREALDPAWGEEVGPHRCCSPRHPTLLEPSCLEFNDNVYDAASDICLALRGGTGAARRRRRVSRVNSHRRAPPAGDGTR